MMLLFSRDIQQSVLPQLDIPTDQLVSNRRRGVGCMGEGIGSGVVGKLQEK